ncbi:MAG TPA: 2-C-methyl-D-erythritol 4-phosphate cytidylyltransferase [Acidimicrobiales bacterium]|nr:2-C-methyl-D-erythritol 4-phosphate cytidylyltransferase [Acidimicrobiales bacterium]
MPQTGRQPAGVHGAVWTIVVAAGVGVRFGTRKQYELLGSRRVLDWALDSARAVSDGIVLAVPVERAGEPEPAADVVVAGGESRSASVRAGLAATPDDAEVIVVHDAARPLAPEWLFENVVAAVRAGADGVVPALPIADTVKRVRGGEVEATLDRSELVTVQTPQAFRADVLRKAHAGGDEASDDAALVEAVAGRVVVVVGDPLNAKVTSPHDLERAREHVGRLGL